MNDNEIVLSLLDFYKKKGIDLYKILDDPSFKSLSRDTQLKAIQTYAQHIINGTRQGSPKTFLRDMIKGIGVNAGVGALSGALSGVGFAKAFHGGRIPIEAPMTGAVIGVLGGILNSSLNAVNANNDRNAVLGELGTVAEQPTPHNAFRVLIANNLRGMRTEGSKSTINGIRNEINGTLKSTRDTEIKSWVTAHNHALGNEPV